MKKLTISLHDNGEVYRGDKLIATVSGDDITFKHHAYKKHRDEIEIIMSQGDLDLDDEQEEEEPPVTPAHLFLEGNGRWYGEANPPVVLWRKDNWTLKQYDAKYGDRFDVLCEIFDKEGMKYEG